MFIYGFGLPRSGTTSLSQALEMMGFKTLHYCPLTNSQTLTELELNAQNYDAVVTARIPIFQDWTPTHWIYCKRNRSSWAASMESMGVYSYEDYEEPDISNLSNLLILPVEEQNKWDKLSNFLNTTAPQCDYPHSNRSGPSYQI